MKGKKSQKKQDFFLTGLEFIDQSYSAVQGTE